MEHPPPPLALPIPPDIAAVRARLDRWRQKRPRRARIPDALWQAATALARQHGAGKVARVLRLDYYALRRRVTAAGGSGRSYQATRPAFVELLPTTMAAPACECVVECERPDGARMRIQLRGAASAPDLAALSERFWHGTP
jgi:hypothetical protein